MAQPEVLLVYDKQCPACNLYCNLLRIRDTVGPLILLDARQGGPIMDEITAAGLDIDQGMVLKAGARLYYGAEAIHVLALMSTKAGLFNRVAYWWFASRRIANVLYPALRSGRNLLLKLLRRTKINNLRIAGNERF
jgi:predicted DCC family thiol-disulfide oxidoreductase YuxK